MPSRMRLSAPTEGFIWLDSISEIVELVTPERLASSRCDSLLRLRTKRSRSPTSMLIVASTVGTSLLRVLRIEQMLSNDPSKFNGLGDSRKGLAAYSSTWCRWGTAEEPSRDDSPVPKHPKPRRVLDAFHGKPAVQPVASLERFGRWRALHDIRWPQVDRPDRRALS